MRRALGLLALAPLLSPAVAGAAAPGWSLSTERAAASAAAPPYLGNGYVGTRIPADGAGRVTAPVATETHIAGVYADVPDPITGGTQRQGSVELPGWTRLDVVVGGRRYAASDARDYRQELDLRRGVLTTRATWSVGGRVTELRYDVALDRSNKRVGVVRLRLTPRWSGSLQVREVLGDGGGDALRRLSMRAGLVAVRTAGTNTTIAEAARLRVPAGASVRPNRATRIVDDPGAGRAHVRGLEGRRLRHVAGHAESRAHGTPRGDRRTASRRRPRAQRRRLGPSVAGRHRHPRTTVTAAPRAGRDVLPARQRPPGRRLEHQPGRPVRRRLQRPRLLGRRDVDVPGAARPASGRREHGDRLPLPDAGRGRAQRSANWVFRAALRMGERADRGRGHADVGGDRAPGAAHHRGRRARAVAALPRDWRPRVVARRAAGP